MKKLTFNQKAEVWRKMNLWQRICNPLAWPGLIKEAVKKSKEKKGKK